MANTTRTPSMEMKRLNRNRIYRYILKSEVTSNPDIAYALKISLPTATQNTRELIERGLVREAGKLESTGGKRAVGLSAVPDFRLAVGLDITRNHVSLVMTDVKGGLLRRERVFLPYAHTEAYFRDVNARLEAFIDRCGAERERILGIGISYPGIVNSDLKAITSSHVLHMEPIPFAYFDRFFAYPCRLLNDANAGAYAEGCHSAYTNRLFYLSLSSTVGGAIYENGELVLGRAFRCGEVGHMTIELNGAPCYCGKRGCLDVYCASSRLSDLTGGSLEAFFSGLESGDPRCGDAWERYTDYLAVALDNIHMVLDCDIMLGGYVGGHIDGRIADIRRKVAERGIFKDETPFVHPCFFKYEAAAMGAALSVMEDFIDGV